MNRLQKKCVIVSAALHGLLVVVLLFGAALMPRQEPVAFRRITLYALATDAPTSGGSPVALQQPPPSPPSPPAPPVARPEPPQPQQRQQVQQRPAPETQRVTTQRTQQRPVAAEPPPPRPSQRTLAPSELTMTRRNTSSTSTTPTRRQPDTSEADAAAAAAATAAANAAARAAAERRVNNAVSGALQSISDGTPTSSAVNIAPGIGDGPLMANYRDIVASKYTAAWTPPPGLQDERATVTVSVTIYRDGRVIAHQIKKRSGNASMDQSIQRTLENVTFVEVFPAGSRDTQRTFTIEFNLAAKRMIG